MVPPVPLGAFVWSTIVWPYQMRALPNLYHQMQFFTLHRMSIFSNSLDNDNNEKKVEFIEKSSLFIYMKKVSVLQIFIPKKGF